MKILNRFIDRVGRLFSPQQNEESFRGKIRKFERELKQLRVHLVEIVFRRKCYEEEISKINSELLLLHEDLEEAVRRDQDEILTQIVQSQENLEEKLAEKKKGLEFICGELESAKKVESSLEKQLEQFREKIAVFEIKTQTVELAEKLQKQRNDQASLVGRDRLAVDEVNKSLFKLEAKLEQVLKPSDALQGRLESFRKDRTHQRHFEKAMRIKAGIKNQWNEVQSPRQVQAVILPTKG